MATPTKKFSTIDTAKIYLRGEKYEKNKIKKLCEDLEDSCQFGYAAEVILKNLEELEANGDELTDEDYHPLVRNIYKDTSISSFFKYDRAVNILRSDCGLEKTDNCESLGMAGAIFKYKWKFDRQVQNLYRSLSFYEKGYNAWLIQVASNNDTDLGYTAINYAFVSDLVMLQFLGQSGSSEAVTEGIVSRFGKAMKVRQEIVETYIADINAEVPILKAPAKNNWQYATLAEAFFGLRMYKQALHMIAEYTGRQTIKWKLRSFVQQMYQVADFQNLQKKYNDAGENYFRQEEIDIAAQLQCLAAIDNKNSKETESPRTIEKRGLKKGLALSGGGFRAALFQIGILAALAEADELSDVEVISCVSGGSIIGAYYYLHLKKLFETKTDDEIGKDDYIQIVKDIETDFLKATQHNLRMLVFTNLFDNLKMIFSSNYSRSHRLGSLYQQYFYLPLYNKDRKDADKKKEIFMEDLKIDPKGFPAFSIAVNNWERTHKIPQLILNATCLNTGHNWQFTSTWMGEPPAYLSKSFDVKKRLRRMYYKDAPEGYKQFPLGNAVAASSCVPVLFEPLVLKDLYVGIDVELVDGGVHDNQGIASILEQECDCIYVCDGSAQLPDAATTTANELSLFFRVDNVVQERVRETQLLDLKARKYAAIVRELKIMHLKNELTQGPLSWIDCDDEPRAVFQNQVKKDDDLLEFGLMKNVQKLLSEVRTDLDSFNDAEAYALMYSGYRQTMTAFELDVQDYKNDWNFLQVADHCIKPGQQKKLSDLLSISASVPFKLVKKYKGLQWLLYVLGGVFLILLIGFFKNNWGKPIPINYGVPAMIVLTMIAGYFSKFLVTMLDVNGFVRKQLFLIALGTAGWIIFNAYIIFFNPWYNYSGKLKNIR